MGNLAGKTVLISDASSPSGKAAAAVFAGEETKLALNFRTGSVTAGAGIYSYDMTGKNGVEALVADVIRDFGTIDVLICNENFFESMSIQDSTDSSVLEVFDRNAKSAFMLTQAAGEVMKNQKSGSIVYISSIHADKPTGSSFAYSMAKAAVGMLCKETAINLGSYGIRVNVIEMGPVDGDDEIFRSDLSRLYDHLHLKLYRQPAGTWDQAARLAVFLSDGNCTFINGQSITLDGGFLLNYGYKLNYEEVQEAIQKGSGQFNRVFDTWQPPEATGGSLMDLTGKTAIVTGSATGVGQGIAVMLAARGMNVVVTHNKVSADKTMSMIEKAGGNAIDVSCNVGDDDSVAGLVAAAKQAFGGVDVLINNAMIQPNRWLLEYTPEEYDSVMNVNALGYTRCIRHAVPLLKQSKAGRVINISSIHSKRPGEFDPVYSMTKAAIQMLTREAAIELAPFGITSNAITLGAIRVGPRSSDHNFKPGRRIEHREMPYGLFLSGRSGVPADAGHITAFLASEESQFITGSSIRADGGAMLAFF